MRLARLRWAVLLLLFPFTTHAPAQQACDESFQYEVPARGPRFENARGVWIDEAHHNFHTASGRYCGFAHVLRSHGLEIRSNDRPFSTRNLGRLDVLVIANAADAETARLNHGDDPWVLPNRSAFTSDEIVNITRWVEAGGRLLLIADHMPFPGSADELAKAFGFSFINGYAAIDDRDLWPSQFTKKDGTLRAHAVTADIPSVASFTGSAFRVPETAVPLMLLGSGHTMVLTSRSGYPFSDDDPRFSAEGLCQGALLEFGKGKVAVFGEAAMFTTQTSSDGTSFGLQAERAPHNIAFLLNLMRWLVE